MPTLTVIRQLFGNAFSAITQGFVTGASGHKGLDLAAPPGTPVHAIVGGTVVYAENASNNVARAASFWVNNSAGTESGGNAVIIQAADGKRYFYEHLQGFNVAPGQTITAGTQIGTVGATGNATGPHLHFAMADWNNKTWIDPTVTLSQMYYSLIQQHPFGWTTDPATGGLVNADIQNQVPAGPGLIPDITGAVVFIGIILVGVAFLFLAGQVAKVRTSEASS